MSDRETVRGDYHQSRAERYAAGKKLRSRTPRESHGDHQLNDKRDPVAILAEIDEGRIAALLPIRYQRMAVSPFKFLRGAAAVMAIDLARGPLAGVSVQSCGDCHLMNFGAFLTPEGNVRPSARHRAEREKLKGLAANPQMDFFG